jgi:hypothetical protein
VPGTRFAWLLQNYLDFEVFVLYCCEQVLRQFVGYYFVNYTSECALVQNTFGFAAL